MRADPYVYPTGIEPKTDFQWSAGRITLEERYGAHAFFAFRIPFIPSLLGSDFTRMVGGQRSRADMIDKRLLRFITDIGTAKDDSATFDLRFICDPSHHQGENARIEVVLLGKVFKENQRQAEELARKLARKLRTHFPSEDPFNYPLEPVDEAGFRAAFDPVPIESLDVHQVLEIRKFEDRDPLLQDEGDIRGYFPHPFSPVFHFSAMGRFIETLSKQQQKCVVSIALRPTVLFPGELLAITQAINNYAMVYDESDAGLKLVREERLEDMRRTYAPLVSQRNLLFQIKVQVVGAEYAPDDVIEALGSEFMDNDTEEPRLWSKVAPETQGDLTAARNNLRLLEFEPWGLQITESRLLRLRSLVCAHEAVGAFRLPIPPESGYLPGLQVRDEPFVLPSEALERDERVISLGEVIHRGNATGVQFEIPLSDLKRHMLIAGSTGSGKTNTSLHLLSQLWKQHHVPFLVMYPIDKPDYRLLMGDPDIARDLLIFTLGDESTSPFRFNPFVVPEGILLKTHLSLLLRCFSAAFVLWDPLPAVFREALRDVYAQAGWDVVRGIGGPSAPAPPTLAEFYESMLRVADRLTRDYGAEVRGNVRQGAVIRVTDLVQNLGHVFNVRQHASLESILSVPAVFELGRSGSSEDIALVMGFLLMSLTEHVQSRFRLAPPSERRDLHVMLVEEAHRLMAANTGGGGANTADSRARGGEDFSNILAEVRGFNEAIMIAEQIPTSLVQGAVANTHVKVMHWLEDPASYELLSDVVNLDERQRQYARTLRTGDALVRAQDGQPAHVRVTNYLDAFQALDDVTLVDDSDAAVVDFMRGRMPLPPLEPLPNLDVASGAAAGRWGAPCLDCTVVCRHGASVGGLDASLVMRDAPVIGQLARTGDDAALDALLARRLQDGGLGDGPTAAYCYLSRVAASRSGDGRTNHERYAFVRDLLASFRSRHGIEVTRTE